MVTSCGFDSRPEHMKTAQAVFSLCERAGIESRKALRSERSEAQCLRRGRRENCVTILTGDRFLLSSHHLIFDTVTFMAKNFDHWNACKKILDTQSRRLVFRNREVWWAHIGLNIGVEIDGKHELFLRPVIVLTTFNMHMAFVVPTTSQDKFGNHYLCVASNSGKNYTVCLTQARSISCKRLLRKIDTISESDFQCILNKLCFVILGK